jgi:hypothetical protein
MERGRDCVERNRSERAKVASVAEWKPPASPKSSPPAIKRRESMPRVVVIFGKDT